MRRIVDALGNRRVSEGAHDPMRLRSKLTAGLLAGFLWACASQPEPVRPVSEILAAPPEFVDITSTTATLLVTTELDVACAVVYGPTTDFGMLATDMDMAGGAHAEHHPLLTGLEPDTLYYARLQGSDASGALYRSEVFTFRTAPAQAADRGSNLGLLENGGRVVAVSSNFGGGDNEGAYGASSAVDGDPGTEWSSDGDGDEAWIEIELATRSRISSIGFWTRTMGSSAQVESFRIITDQGETYGPYELSGAAQAEYFQVDFTAQRLRFEVVSSSGGNTGAVEIEVYGEAAQ